MLYDWLVDDFVSLAVVDESNDGLVLFLSRTKWFCNLSNKTKCLKNQKISSFEWLWLRNGYDGYDGYNGCDGCDKCCKCEEFDGCDTKTDVTDVTYVTYVTKYWMWQDMIN